VSAYHCFKCGLPNFGGISGYAGPQCQCFFGRIEFQQIPPASPPRYGQTVPFVPVDEETVRRIVREEIQKALKEST